MPVYRLPQQRGPFAQFISLLVFIVAIVMAVVLGTVALLAVLAVAILIALRHWWLKRQRTSEGSSPGRGDYIEGEYTVTKEEPRRRD